MNAAEFIQFFLTICGGISIVGGAAAVIVKWIAPAFRLNRRVEVLEDHDRRDFETLKRIADRDSLILEVLSTMLDSQISGNNVEELKKMKQKLTEYLTANQR
ncbi:CTP synthase [Blautia sp. MSJ-19]|uniref:CTP synthase n=1 Tax=Blautia sp. MSJ-19 TaxID=2841517 RepID=UPI001C0EBD45|nr:CTP synthase [Blautia sp. MSJ-19]MBU5481726.1 CTP synthase [Blautia sp. MSJ-19]